jgi:histidinol-phosphate aminotransferase
VKLRDRVNPHILELDAYQPGKPIEELERELGISDSIKLASNENPNGASKQVVEAIRGAANEIHRYPDGACFALRARLAGDLGVEASQLVFGCGADEILELLAKVLLAPGDEVVFAWPSFAMYPIVARGMGALPVPVPLDAKLCHDLDAMADAISDATKLVFVCNPNNPTGTSIGAEAFGAFMQRVPEGVVVAIDEAYGPFAAREDFPDALAFVARRPGTIVMRTFSKVFGLAGLRVGFGVADTELAGYLERARHPFNVNRLAEVAALAALDDRDFVEMTLRENAAGRDFLTCELRAKGFEVWPSDANFVLVRAGVDVYDPLLAEGVIVRPMAGFGLPDCVRVSVGTARENRRFVEALCTVTGAGR